MTVTTTTRAVQSAARLDPRPDADLLTRFLNLHDQAAFATLVQRHGSLVYGVCRRALGATADADDAFQATFLVLVKRAAAIPWRANLGPWLFGVANRVSAKARFRRDRRFALEKQVDAMPHPETSPADRTESDDLSRLFDEELAKLPEEMRRAVVLCELQGLSRREAAKQLRISEGTLSSRLGRARKKLVAALAGRGLTLAVPAGVALLATLASATVRAATDPAGAVPAGVTYLVQEALKAMTISKLKLGAVLAAVAVGFSWVAFAADPKPITPPAVKADEKAVPPKAEVPPADAPEKKGKMELSISLRKAREPVATVNGQDVKREEFAEYLIQKYGAKEIELFVHQRIIQDAAAEKDIRLPADEVMAAFEADAKAAGVSRDEFVKVVLPRYGKTEHEWWTEVLTPRLILTKLGGEVTASEKELREAFETQYGERRLFESVHTQHYNEVELEKEIRAQIRSGQTSVQAIGKACGVSFQATPVEIGRYPRNTQSRRIADAVFATDDTDRLVEVNGDHSDTMKRTVFCRFVRVLPPTGTKFEDVKEKLRAEVVRDKTDAAIPKLFAKLKEEAKPVYHLKPEPKTFSVPLPVKK